MISPDLLDPASLDHVMAPFGSSRVLPAAAYTSPDVFAWEREHFFAGTWTCLGRRPARGQQAYAVGDISVLVTTTNEGVRAFPNVCRHRGHELLAPGEAADGRAVVCPYHGWAYGMDGSLLVAPQMGEDFDRTPWGLRELPIVDWHGWLFVNASGAAVPFAGFIGEADAYIAPYRPELLTVNARHRYEVAANWKLIAENYHECYHCPMIHPELCRVTIPDSGENGTGPGAWVGGPLELMPHARTMSLDGAQGPGAVALPGDQRRVTYVGIFPNLLVSAHPDYVLTHRFVPLTVNRTLVECEWLFLDPTTDPAYAVDFWDTTNRQDWAAVESVQRGMASRHHEPGPLAPAETAVYDWVTMLARGYRDPATIPRPAVSDPTRGPGSSRH
jgi:glycine betaine catabolism A